MIPETADRHPIIPGQRYWRLYAQDWHPVTVRRYELSEQPTEWVTISNDNTMSEHVTALRRRHPVTGKTPEEAAT